MTARLCRFASEELEQLFSGSTTAYGDMFVAHKLLSLLL